jgi:Cu2+-exporting ATPase
LPTGIRPLHRAVNGERLAFCCYGCCIAYQVKAGNGEEWEAAWLLVRIGVGAFLSMNIMLFSLVIYAGAFTGADARMLPTINYLLLVLATPAVVLLGEPFARDTWLNARQGRLTASTLIVLGVAAAYAYSVVAVIENSTHVYFDTSCMVLMLFTIGRYLEAAGRARAARDLQPLLAAESEWATIVEDDAERRVAVRQVLPGVLVRVRPGERIPVDGVIVDGESHADEAVITGESRPIAKGPGAAAIAGSINLDGVLLIRVSGAGNATRWAQICRSVRDALVRRSPSQRVADAVVGLLVPVVLALGAGTVFYWARHLPFDRALLVGLAVLVVACPCAVGLAAPLATTLGIGRLARRGCLVRDPAALEALARIGLVAFDKTGTLTSGEARVVDVVSEGVPQDEVLARAAGLERHCEHSLARGIVAAAAQRGLVPVATRDVRVVPGRGVTGTADVPVAAGNAALMRELGWRPAPRLMAQVRALEASGYSVIQVGWAGRVHALVSLDDSALPDAPATIEALKSRGLSLRLMTGDLADAGRRIADAVGIAEVQAGLSPEDKRALIDRDRSEQHVVAMVGDGLNDAPVLAQADIGIAVGSATDLARETAALVLPPGGLWLLPWVIDVARTVRRIILGNLFWAFGYNLVAVTLAMFGLLQPVFAAAVMAGSSLLVVMNSLRLERLPDPVPPLAPARAAAPAENAPLDMPVVPAFADQAIDAVARANGPVSRSARTERSGLHPVGLAALLLVAGSALLDANPGNAEIDRGSHLAALCAACHRMDGRDAGIPAIVGVDEAKLVRMLAAFKSGERPSQIMHAVALSLSDEEIASVAHDLAARGKDTRP